MSEQQTLQGTKSIEEDKVLVRKSSIDRETGVAEGVKLRKIEASDGRTMRQRWDVTLDSNTGEIIEQTNYKQIGAKAWSGSHMNKDKREDMINIEDGRTRNQATAERQNIVANMPTGSGMVTVAISDASQIGRLVEDETVPDGVTRDYIPDGLTVGDFRDGFDQDNASVTYDTQ